MRCDRHSQPFSLISRRFYCWELGCRLKNISLNKSFISIYVSCDCFVSLHITIYIATSKHQFERPRLYGECAGNNIPMGKRPPYVICGRSIRRCLTKWEWSETSKWKFLWCLSRSSKPSISRCHMDIHPKAFYGGQILNVHLTLHMDVVWPTENGLSKRFCWYLSRTSNNRP